MLTIENLHAQVESRTILKGIDLDIKAGEVHAIMGPNGSGKSTLLGICAGVFYPDKGKVTSFSNNFGYIGVTPLISVSYTHLTLPTKRIV